MNPEQAGNYLAAILSTAVVGVFIPLLILGFLLWGVYQIIKVASANPNGFLGQMMCDDAGKPSTDRVVRLVAVAITSWMASVIVFAQPQLIVEVMSIYMAGWGGIDLTKHWLSTRPELAAAKQTPAQPPQQ